MAEISEIPTELAEKPKKKSGPKVTFIGPDDAPLSLKSVDKFHRDVLRYHNGCRVEGKKEIVRVDIEDPLAGRRLLPGQQSPICEKCGLDSNGARHPYMRYAGPTDPLVTVLFDSVSAKEDERGAIATDGPSKLLLSLIHNFSEQTGVSVDDIRWVPITRCAHREGKMPQFKTKGNWCRHYAIQDLMDHPPKLVMPIGTASLGLLCHKSNAQDWSGRLLTWRGWPDDWLTDQDYVLPRPDPRDKDKTIIGHPIFGAPPKIRIPMVPLQAPRLVWLTQNNTIIGRWKKQLLNALIMAKQGVTAKNYDRPWYRLFTEFRQVKKELERLAKLIEDHPGLIVCYDTETTGLKALPYVKRLSAADEITASEPKIVFMMFRWINPETDQPESMGFPWDYPTSKLYQNVDRLAPYVIEVLTTAQVLGHNITFDVLFTAATVAKKQGQWRPFLEDGTWNQDWIDYMDRINRLASAAKYDSWHMAFAARQRKGTLGLEAIAYDYAPELAGYEEEMTLLIELYGDELDPANSKGGHYAMCPEHYWDTHFKPYVMGDVEVCYQSFERIKARLDDAITYKIPLANPNDLGRFRFYKAPSRPWLYGHIMSPAARCLMKMMARGIYVDRQELLKQECEFPQMVNDAKTKLRGVDQQIEDWCTAQEQAAKRKTEISPDGKSYKWELDLENKGQLKDLLFRVLKLPVQRLTKAGKKLFGENTKDWDFLTNDQLLEYAATDKYTLNKLAVDFKNIRPLQEYRKIFKLYSTYVRPLRNLLTEGIDKKSRVKDPHLCADGCIHASFMLTGTRGGRLSCQEPNMQQLPNDAQVKKMFTSRFGERGCIYTADLSQIELRLMAAACGDKSMVQAYFDNADLHSLTTSKIFKLPYEHFSKAHMEELQKSGKKEEAKKLELKRRIGKCVDPDTLVSVDGRIVRIGDLHAGREPDTFYSLQDKCVQTPGGRQPIKSFYCDGVRESVLICTLHGILKCSLAHKFMLADGTLLPAGDIKVGMVLKAGVPLESANEDVAVLFDPFSDTPKSDIFRVHVTEDIAYVLGLFYGDGISVTNRIEICTGGTSEFFKWQDVIAESLTRCGFDQLEINRTQFSGTKVSEKLGEVTGAWGTVCFGSTRVQELFHQLGAIDKFNKWRRTLIVPGWMFNTRENVKLAFVAGVVDTDGWINKDGSICICSKSWRFAQDLMTLCATAGIACTVSPSWNKAYERYYFTVRVARRDSDGIARQLRHPNKKGKVKPVSFRYSSRVPNKVKLVLAQDASVLVDISLDNPHLYLPEGLTTHQTVNFLTGYGGGAFGLQNTLANSQVYLPLEECEVVIESFFDAYPSLKRFLGMYKGFIEQNGVAVSILGRVRIFEEVFGEDREATAKALRAGCNHLIQSTASDMMLICLFVIEDMMRDAGLMSLLVSTVHDSIMIDTFREELSKVHGIVDFVMNNIPAVLKAVLGDDYDDSWMIVPFSGDSECGINYLETSKISGDDPDWDKLLSPKNG